MRWTPGRLYFVVGLAIAALAVLSAFWADWVYGDWRCAFAHCRLVK